MCALPGLLYVWPHPVATVGSAVTLCGAQLQGRFEQLKRMHHDDKCKLDEKRRLLEDEMNTFSKRKAATELLQAQSFNTNANMKKDKDRKK